MADPVFERYKDALKRGHVAVYRGRHREALDHYQEAARLASHRPLPYASMGSVLLQMGRHADALAAFDEALRRAPDDRQSLSGKAAVLAATGRRAEAAPLLQRVAELEAEEVRARTERTAAARGAGPLAGPERIVLAAEQARLAGQEDVARDAYVAAAAGFQEQGQLDAALDACLRALSLGLGAPATHLQMVRIYFQRGWGERAVERMLLLERSLALADDPPVRAALRDLARLHVSAHPRLGAILAASPS